MTDNRPTLDVGKFTADKPNLFDVFVGYCFWLNKFGDDPYPPRIAPVPDTHGEQRAMSASPGTSSSAMRARAIPVLLAAVLAGCAQRDSRVASAAGQTLVVCHGLDQACMHRGMVKELADHDWTIRSVLEFADRGSAAGPSLDQHGGAAGELRSATGQDDPDDRAVGLGREGPDRVGSDHPSGQRQGTGRADFRRPRR